MNAERDRLAAKWFERACDLAPPARRELLAELVREDTELARRVEELLELDGCTDLPLDRPAYAGANGLRAPDPESLGRYRILRRLGAGGMGVVYEAEQDHPRRRVALKVLRGGFVDAATLRRFEHEAQVLGWLQHPGIAQVYEAGAALSNGAMQPYIAMELVHGVCLSEFVRERAPGVPQLLQLAIALCEAIDHAHKNGVVHRDLKPSNVLVDESGRPRVLDFGIARILRADVEDTAVRTRAGDVLGTPAYMSPEQLEGASEHVDARADVYALGVMLYEMLARRRPHEVDGLGLREVERAVLESDPPLLGTLDRRWRGDLELIVAKALEKDRERRYPSANALAADLKRHLANEPISARKPGFAYRTQRFVRRHRALVVGALAVFLALSAGLAATWRMYLRAEAARADEHAMRTKAEDSEAALRETNEYFLSLLEAPIPELGGIDVRMIDVLERAANRIATAFPDRPLQRARLFQSLARTYFGLGEYSQANRYAGEALELWEEHAPSEHETTIDLRQSRAVALAQLGDVSQALEQIDAALAVLRDEDGPLRRATVHGTRSRVLLALERFEEAEREARATAAILDANPSLRAADAAPERLTLVKVLMLRGELDEAEQVCRESIETQQAESSDETFELLHTHAALAQVLHRRGRPQEAIPSLERALAGFAKLAGPAHPLVATHTGNLAALMLSVGRASDAEPLMREALERARAAVTGPDASVAMKLCTLAQIVRARGDLAQAEQLLREGLAQLEALEQPREVLLANVLLHLGQTLARQGAHEEGAVQLQRSLELHERTLGRDRSETAGVAEALAESQRALGNNAAAAESLELAFAARSAVEGANSGAALGAASELAMTWLDLGRIDEALALATECLTSAERDHAANELLLAQVRATSGCCRVRSGDLTAAIAAREALAVLEAGLGPEHPLAARVRAHLDAQR